MGNRRTKEYDRWSNANVEARAKRFRHMVDVLGWEFRCERGYRDAVVEVLPPGEGWMTVDQAIRYLEGTDHAAS